MSMRFEESRKLGLAKGTSLGAGRAALHAPLSDDAWRHELGGKVNRDQVRDCAAILGTLVPVMVDLMLDNPEEDWGRPFYQVVGPMPGVRHPKMRR